MNITAEDLAGCLDEEQLVDFYDTTKWFASFAEYADWVFDALEIKWIEVDSPLGQRLLYYYGKACNSVDSSRPCLH